MVEEEEGVAREVMGEVADILTHIARSQRVHMNALDEILHTGNSAMSSREYLGSKGLLDNVCSQMERQCKRHHAKCMLSSSLGCFFFCPMH